MNKAGYKSKTKFPWRKAYCLHCKEEFWTRHPDKKFCKEKCRVKSWQGRQT